MTGTDLTNKNNEQNVVESNEQDHQTLTQESPKLLSREETREILTPFAFEIDKSLFGIALANPWSRGFAMLVDLLAIAILSGAPGELLAIVIAVTAFKLGSKKRAQQMGKVKGRKRRAAMRFTGAFILFVVLLDTLPGMFNQIEDNPYYSNNASSSSKDSVSQELTPAATKAILASVIKFATTVDTYNCSDYSCWLAITKPIVETFGAFDIKEKQAKNAIDDLVDEIKLSKAEKQQLEADLFTHYQNNIIEMPNVDSVEEVAASVEKSSPPEPEKEQSMEDRPVYSIMKYIEGLIEDLGLGFGWAAFYFTVLTSVWKGQTVGKKLFGIRVIQLDGTPLSIWDSFGRYGGYGAGIATGLLGFAQIFWNPNRQAIHDKISATVVINAKIESSNKE